MRSHILSVSLASTFLVGCTVLPTVQYRMIKGPADMAGMTDSFYLQRSEIEIAMGPEAKDAAGKPVAQDPTITSLPRETRESKVGIRAVTNWRSSTVVTVNKFPNTDLVSSIGVEVTDNTAKSITSYGGALVKLLGIVADAAPAKPASDCLEPGKKITISFPADIQSGKTAVEGYPCIEVTVFDRPVEALETNKLPIGVDTHNYYYAACRDVEISFDPKGKKPMRKRVRISDPSFVQFVQFPPKGSITSHSECGVSVKTDAAAPDNGAAIIDALATQGKAIKDALDAASKK